MKIYYCANCGNQIMFLNEMRVIPTCCGQKMLVEKENIVEASVEKHLPKITQIGNRVLVNIGVVDHPMLDEHHIEYIILETNMSITKKDLSSNEFPRKEFLLVDGEKAIAAYAYCNLHGLWKKVI